MDNQKKIFLSIIGLLMTQAFLLADVTSSHQRMIDLIDYDKSINIDNDQHAKGIDTITQTLESIKEEKHTGNERSLTRASIINDPQVYMKLKGKWIFNYSIISTFPMFTNYISLTDVEYTTSGYMLAGTVKTSPSGVENLIGCFYDIDSSFNKSEFLCIKSSSLGEEYTSWYYINIVGDDILSGEYDIGTSTEASNSYTNDTTYKLVGLKNLIKVVPLMF